MVYIPVRHQSETEAQSNRIVGYSLCRRYTESLVRNAEPNQLSAAKTVGVGTTDTTSPLFSMCQVKLIIMFLHRHTLDSN